MTEQTQRAGGLAAVGAFLTGGSRAPLLAALLLLAIVVGVYWLAEPQGSATGEILRQAQAAPRSYRVLVTETWTGWTSVGEVRSEVVAWYESAGRWRYEITRTEAPPNEKMRTAAVMASDGTAYWQVHADSNAAFVINLDQLPFRPMPARDLPARLQQQRGCRTFALVGGDTVAGRAVDVFEVGPPTCAGAEPAEAGSRQVQWVDKETLFVLKVETYSAADGQLLGRQAATSVTYDARLDDALFTFQPPPGMHVQDERPFPPERYAEELARLASEAATPLFVPSDIPAGLAPRRPKWGERRDNWMTITYAPPLPTPTSQSFSISQRPAAGSGVTVTMEQTEPVGTGAPDGLQMRFVRDGTAVWLTSKGLTREEFLHVVTSLVAVPRPPAHHP